MAKPTITLLYDTVEDQEEEPGADPPVYREVSQALEERGYAVATLAACADIRKLVAEIENDGSDLIFNLCESLAGKDKNAINVAALLELLGKPFTGTGSYGQTLAMDKALSKKIFSFHGIGYPKFSTMAAGQVEWSDELEFPLFVKPSNTDSSVGIDARALCTDIKQLMERISFIHTEIRAPVLIEEFIEGRELFVAVLGNNERMTALPIVEWDFSKVKNGPRFATAEAKWDKDSEGYKAPELFPQDIPSEVYAKIQTAAIDACKALRIQDYGRVDMRLRKKGDDFEIFIIEVNPNPYLERKAEVAMAAQKHEMAYADLVEQVVDHAIRRTALES